MKKAIRSIVFASTLAIAAPSFAAVGGVAPVPGAMDDPTVETHISASTILIIQTTITTVLSAITW